MTDKPQPDPAKLLAQFLADHDLGLLVVAVSPNTGNRFSIAEFLPTGWQVQVLPVKREPEPNAGAAD